MTITTPPLFLMWIKTDRRLVRMKEPFIIDVRLVVHKKGDTSKIKTHQYIQLHTGVKEIQQLNPGGPNHRHSIRP